MFLRLWFSLKRWDCLWFWSLEDLVQVLYGILNPLLLGVSTDIFSQLGPEAGEESKQSGGYSEKFSPFLLRPSRIVCYGVQRSLWYKMMVRGRMRPQA